MSGPMTAEEIARRSIAAMWAGDAASQGLGMRLEAAGPGTAVLAMTVARQHVNGHGICHGGLIFTLADSAFACASNSYNQRAVAQHATVTFVAPAKLGDRLTATARELSRNGRTGLYDVAVTNQDGALVAAFRGASRTLAGEHFRPAEGRTNDAGSAPRPG